MRDSQAPADSALPLDEEFSMSTHAASSCKVASQPTKASEKGRDGETHSLGVQIARKMHIFSTSTRVNPLGSHEERQKAGKSPQPQRPASPKQQRSTALPELTSWSSLPENVVEKVFQLLRADVMRSEPKRPVFGNRPQRDQCMLLAHTLSGVSRTWRRVGMHVFLSEWWTAGRINHPSQCMFLAPRVFPSLMRCFVERVRTIQGVRFLLYQGERLQRETSKFLMAADLSRFEMRLYLTKPGTRAHACGAIDSNLLCTKYSFSMDDYVRGARPGSQNAPVLAEVEYRTRLQGCMRPRRIRVTLPGTNLLPDAVNADSMQAGVMLPSCGREPANPAGLAHAPAPGASRSCTKLQKGTIERSEAMLAKQGQPVHLRNKTPHWNEHLKCWCLNFRGRVKFASVKNFQLADAEEDEEIVMQFGKVAQDIYILDFQPATISTAQAFAVALSAFNKGLCLC